MSLIFSQSLSYYAIHLKVILISTTVISAAFALKVTAPAIADFAVTDAPSIYNGVVSWLKPPYLYLVINCIIIILFASSKLQSKVVDYESSPLINPLLAIPVTVPVPVQVFPPNEILSPIKNFNYVDYLVHEEAVEAVRSEDIQLDDDSLNSDVKYYDEPVVWENEKVVEDIQLIELPAAVDPLPSAEVEISDHVSLSKSSWSPSPLIRRDSSEFLESNEKPLVSARFRRSVKGSPEGGKRSLRVSKSRKQDTIENTWKTITEGRAMPLARHLKKSDTWETRGGLHHIPVPPQDAKMTKTETFHDHSTTITTKTNTSSSSNSLQSLSHGPGKLKREASLSQDDLNKRVEAFIKKFNEEMRMQRQESLNQYSEMITPGAHY